MKGDGAAAIVAVGLIVVGIAAMFIYFQNPGAIIFPQFSIKQVVYSNDIITVTNKYVSDTAPYEGQPTTIEFVVSNNGPKDIEGVEVVLDPPTGFTSKSSCDGKDVCKFKLERGEAIDVLFTLTAIGGPNCGSGAQAAGAVGQAAVPSPDFIGPPTKAQAEAQKIVTSSSGCRLKQIISSDVRYSVRYHYDGTREFHIPILKSGILPKGQSFFAGEPTYGPVRLEYTPPASRQLKDGSSSAFASVTPAGAIPFEMKFSMQHIGSAGIIKPIVMKGSGQDAKNTLVFKRLDNLDILSDECGGVIDKSSKTLKPPFSDDKLLGSLIGFRVPFEFSCSFLPKAGESDFTEGVMEVGYDYDYELLFSDTFSILPIGTQKVGAPTGATGPLGIDMAKIDITAKDTSKELVPAAGTPNIVAPTVLFVATDKSSYSAGSIVGIAGKLNTPSSGLIVTGFVYAPDDVPNKIIQKITDASGEFTDSFTLPATGGKGTWRIKVNQGSLSKEITFTVS